MEGSIALQEDVMEQCANYVKSFTPLEKNPLFVQRLNNKQLFLSSQQKVLFFARNIPNYLNPDEISNNRSFW